MSRSASTASQPTRDCVRSRESPDFSHSHRPGARSLAQLAAATPASRDRYVDFLRALSIAVVVLGHWLMAIVYFKDGRLSGDSALDIVPWLWLSTWVLQVMPLFFFVGGFSNFTGLRAAARRGDTSADFLRGRIRRLMAPTSVFIGIWLVIAVALEVTGGGGALAQATALIAKPLWFLAVYVLVVALAPAMVRIHRRYGIAVPIAMIAGAAVVDVLRIGAGLTGIGYLNFAFVWLFAHQLGFFYADGSLVRGGRKLHLAMAGAGLGVLVALTGSGVYSPSMVGANLPGASNNSPPTVCLIALSVWLVGAAMAVRPQVSRWLARPRPWAAVVAANSVIMTVFLWHLTAALVAVGTLYPLGFPQPKGGTTAWWAMRPLWIAALTVVLAGFVTLFARFEHRGLRAAAPSAGVRAERGATITGIALLVMGLAGFAQNGFADLVSLAPLAPLASGLAVVAGRRLLTGR